MSPLRSSVLAAALAGAVAFGVSAAHADLVEVSLDYQLDPGSLACPSAAEFRKEIARQLGRNPFREESAPHHLLARVYSTASGIGGRVEWRDQNDRWEGERIFSTRKDNCGGMARAMALATAIQIRLLAGQDPSAVSGPVAEPEPTPAPTAEVPEAPSVTESLSAPAPPAAPPPPPPSSLSVEETAPTIITASGPPLALEVGAGIIEDTGRGPLFAMPRLAISWGRPSVVQLRLAASGLGPDAEVSNSAGSARIDRLIIVLGLVRFFRPDQRLQPLLSAGIGWQRLHEHGTSARPDLAAAHDGQVSSGIATLGGGVAFTLARGLSALVELEGLFFRPAVSVKIDSASPAALSGAALFVRGGLLARF